MIRRIPMDMVQKEEALGAGGDIRSKGNEWLRSAFVASGLPRVPREVQIRLAVGLVVRKKKICAWLALSCLKACTLSDLRSCPKPGVFTLLKLRSENGC